MTARQPRVTGCREERSGGTYVVLERDFAAPIDSVWAAVTEPERMARWIGTWSGDPASGTVAFRMTAEGEDCPTETYRILACDPPRRLVVESGEPGADLVWRLELDLEHAGGVTTLRFAQRVEDSTAVENVGPGWEYYLDRLVAAEADADVGAVDFDDYYPAQAADYQALFA